MAKKTKKQPTLWLTREFDYDDGFYRLFSGKKPVARAEHLMEFSWTEWKGRELYAFCPSEFHRLIPNIRLKPGGGPIKVKVSMTKAR